MTSDPRAAHLELLLYAKPGCHLCEDARSFLEAELARRRDAGLPCPALVELNILADPALERAYFETIPVLAIDGHELPLAIRPAQVRAFLDEVLGGGPAADPAPGAARAQAGAGHTVEA